MPFDLNEKRYNFRTLSSTVDVENNIANVFIINHSHNPLSLPKNLTVAKEDLEEDDI